MCAGDAGYLALPCLALPCSHTLLENIYIYSRVDGVRIFCSLLFELLGSMGWDGMGWDGRDSAMKVSAYIRRSANKTEFRDRPPNNRFDWSWRFGYGRDARNEY